MSKDDPSGTLAMLLNGVMASFSDNLHVAVPCRVVSFNATAGTAVVQPLIQTTEKAPSVIQSVPVLGQKFRLQDGTRLNLYPDIEAGDTVYVVCADRQMRGAAAGQISKPNISRRHSKNDAVIVGVFPCSLQSS